MIEFTEGKVSMPVKAVIYGAEGIGKSTLASKMPGAVFLDLEGGTSRLNVRRVKCGDDLQGILDTLSELINDKDKYKVQTIVIDTADALELLITKGVCKKYGKDGIESFGYSKGYTYVAEDLKRVLDKLDAAILAGINVTLLAHAKITKFEQPDEMGAYDRWELKLSKRSAPLLKEWADLLLFCNYKTTVITSGDGMDKKKKVTGGERIMYTSHHSCWDAKNRFDLPPELPLKFESIAKLYEGDKASISFGIAPAAVGDTTEGGELPFDLEPQKDAEESMELQGLRALMAKDGITEDQILKAFRGKYSGIENIEPDVIQKRLLDKWEDFKKFVGGMKL